LISAEKKSPAGAGNPRGSLIVECGSSFSHLGAAVHVVR
jgi:hypothetical protein